MKTVLIVILDLTLLSSAKAIQNCNETSKSQVCLDIENEEKYVPTVAPEPLPVIVNTSISVNEIIDVNDNEQTVTISIKMVLEWHDGKVTVKKSQDEIERNQIWYEMNLNDLKSVWTPSVYVNNAVGAKKFGTFGDDSSSIKSFWYQDPNMLYFAEVLTVTASCEFHFQEFPFDSQYCFFTLTNWLGVQSKVQIQRPLLYLKNDPNENPSTNVLEIKSHKLPYDFTLKSLEADGMTEIGYTYSRVRVQIEMKRNERGRGKVFAGFHLTTGIFSCLSLISFFIEAEMVPGRMGLLVTLYLIMINTYASVDAPSGRGFSLIEVWFIGAQTPILFAILEYGSLLAFRKYFRTKDISVKGKVLTQDDLCRMTDLGSLCISGFSIVIFNLAYWLS